MRIGGFAKTGTAVSNYFLLVDASDRVRIVEFPSVDDWTGDIGALKFLSKLRFSNGLFNLISPL